MRDNLLVCSFWGQFKEVAFVQLFVNGYDERFPGDVRSDVFLKGALSRRKPNVFGTHSLNIKRRKKSNRAGYCVKQLAIRLPGLYNHL